MRKKHTKMKRFLILCLLISSVTFAQKKEEEKKVKIDLPTKQVLRAGNTSYNQNDFAVAEENYNKALEVNPNYEKANYNLGNALYQQKKYEDAVSKYDLVTKTTEDKIVKAESYHNIGNVMMKQKKYEEAVKAYKNALRNNPNDDETRYNLALAQKMIKDKKADNKKNDKKNKDDKEKDKKDKDKKDNKKDNKDDNKKKDKNDKGDKDKKEKGNNKKDPNKDKEGKNDNKKEQDKKPQKSQLSKQQIKQLLEAMNNEENKTQKKINSKKAKGRKIKQEKDW